jgi:DNA-binding CsgD family transcriptional regulator
LYECGKEPQAACQIDVAGFSGVKTYHGPSDSTTSIIRELWGHRPTPFSEIFNEKQTKILFNHVSSKLGRETTASDSPNIGVLTVSLTNKSKLTGMQVFVLIMRCLGVTQQEIADYLGIAQQTLATHERKAKETTSLRQQRQQRQITNSCLNERFTQYMGPFD